MASEPVIATNAHAVSSASARPPPANTAIPLAPESDGGLRNSKSRPTANSAATPALIGPRSVSSTPPRLRGGPALFVCSGRVRVARGRLLLARHARRLVLRRTALVFVHGLGRALLGQLVGSVWGLAHGPPSSDSVSSSAATPGNASSSSPGSGC